MRAGGAQEWNVKSHRYTCTLTPSGNRVSVHLMISCTIVILSFSCARSHALRAAESSTAAAVTASWKGIPQRHHDELPASVQCSAASVYFSAEIKTGFIDEAKILEKTLNVWHRFFVGIRWWTPENEAARQKHTEEDMYDDETHYLL